METIKESGTLEKEILELVLKEILQEQQKLSAAIANQSLMIEALIHEISGIEKTGEDFQIMNPTINTKPIEKLIQNAVSEMEAKVLAQPKITTRKFQILLFPPQDARLFYKIVFGRWLIILVAMLLITDVYKWGLHWSDNRTVIQQRQIEANRIKKAWGYLYSRSGKEIKKVMENAYTKVIDTLN